MNGPTEGTVTPPFHLRLFGGPLLTRDDEEVPLTPMQLALMVVVFGHEGERVSRARIAWLLWEADDDPKARHRISQLLYAITKRMGGVSPFVVEGDEVRGEGVTIEVDLRMLLQPDRQSLGMLGKLIPGGLFVLSHLPSREFEDWLLARRLTVRATARTSLVQIHQSAAAAADWQAAYEASVALLALDPRDERWLHMSLEAAGKAGIPGEATALLNSYRERMKIGVPPRGGGAPSTPAPRQLDDGLPEERQSPPAQPRLRLVGRDSEMRRISDVAASVRRGVQRILIIEGEAGSGKTRLAMEAGSFLAGIGFRVLHGSSTALTAAVPLYPILDAITSGATAEHIRSLPPPWRGVILNLMPEMVDDIEGISPPPVVFPTAVPRRTFEALRRLLQAIGGERPLAIAIDNLHWSDASSIAALQYVLRTWQGCPLLVILTFRPEAVHPSSLTSHMIASLRQTTWVPLANLDDEDAHALVSQIVEDISDQDASYLVTLSGGNPLFLTELSFDWPFERAVADYPVSVPSAVQDIVNSRLAAISDDAARVGQLISVAEFASVECLSEVGGINYLVAAACIEELKRARLVAWQSHSHVAFCHELLRAAVYRDIPGPARQFWHDRLGRWLATNGGTSGALARHFMAAGMMQAGRDAAVKAALDAEERGAVPEAIHFLQAAVEASEVGRDRTDLQFKLAHLQYQHGNYSEAAEGHAEVGPILRAQGRLDLALRAALERADAASEAGKEPPESSLALIETSIREAEASGHWDSYLAGCELKLKILERIGRAEEIPHLLSYVRERDFAQFGPHVRCLADCLLSLSHLFDPTLSGSQSVAWVARAIEDAAELDEPSLVVKAAARRLVVLANMGMLLMEEYHDLLDQEVARSAGSGDFRHQYNTHNNAAVFYMDAGEYDFAARHLAKAQEVIRGEGPSTESRNFRCNRGEWLLATAQHEMALDVFLSLKEDINTTSCRTRVRRFATAGLGLAALNCGDLATARMSEEALGDVHDDRYYDAYTVQAFKAAMLMTRRCADQAVSLLESYAADVEGRLQLSWMKSVLLVARISRRSDLCLNRAALERGATLSASLELTQRFGQFRKLMSE